MKTESNSLDSGLLCIWADKSLCWQRNLLVYTPGEVGCSQVGRYKKTKQNYGLPSNQLSEYKEAQLYIAAQSPRKGEA